MTSLTLPDRELALARLAVYRFLHAALDKPSSDQHRWLLGADFHKALDLLCRQFDQPMPAGALVPESYSDFESRYLACFEVGVLEAPVVLQASHYSRNEPAPRIVHEHILFYKHFGCSAPDPTAEAADHLLNELHFLIHLDAIAQAGQPDPESLDRARRDFLDRHLTRWVPRAAGRAIERGLPALYQTLLALLATAVQEDSTLVGDADPLEHPGKPR